MSRLALCLSSSLALACGASPPSGSATPRIEAGASAGSARESPSAQVTPAPATEADAEPEAEPEAEADADAEAASDADADRDPPSGAPRLSAAVVAHVREIAARRARREDVFIKVGDSATVNRAFMRCFSDDDEVALDGRDSLRPLIDRVRAARVAGTDSFRRESRAAGVGWSVYRVLSGPSSALAEEVRAMSPRYALVMFGGNDVETGSLRRYESRMAELVDRLTRWGVVPILSTIPPRNDDPEADRQVPRFNAALRALAEARRLPLVDLHAAMLAQPDRGLASDGVHPSAPVRDGRARGCDLTEGGLQHGQNVRNLLNLEMMAALRAALAD